jgi:hypothetical protein
MRRSASRFWRSGWSGRWARTWDRRTRLGGPHSRSAQRRCASGPRDATRCRRGHTRTSERSGCSEASPSGKFAPRPHRRSRPLSTPSPETATLPACWPQPAPRAGKPARPERPATSFAALGIESHHLADGITRDRQTAENAPLVPAHNPAALVVLDDVGVADLVIPVRDRIGSPTRSRTLIPSPATHGLTLPQPVPRENTSTALAPSLFRPESSATISPEGQ